MELLEYYRDNLEYLRELSQEFAEEFPKIASRLSLSGFDCEDPYIERLLEGAAFLSARVEKKLDESYFNFLESILSSVSPNVLYPIPSGATLEADLNASNETVRAGGTLPAGTIFDVYIPNIKTPCRFTSVCAAPVSPFMASDVEYLTRGTKELLGNAARGSQTESSSALRIQCASITGTAATVPSRLGFFINLPSAASSMLLRELLSDTVAVYVKHSGGQFKKAKSGGIKFELPIISGATLSEKIRGNALGLQILINFLAYPDFFKFFLMNNLAEEINGATQEFEIVIAFARRENALLQLINKNSLKLNCVPVINVFEKRSDRMNMSASAHEFHITPDKSAMRDYETLSVRQIEIFDERNNRLAVAGNFYNAAPESLSRVCFNQKRRRKIFESSAKARSSYQGTEVFVSFSAGEKRLDDAYQFAADMICTNRDLPLLIPEGSLLVCNSPITQKAAFFTHPTRPAYPLIERGSGEDMMRLSHIAFNLSAMLWQDGAEVRDMLKTMIRNYPIRSPDEMEKITNGIVGVKSETATFRFVKQGRIFFEPGWKITLVLDETAYAGVGVYIFACMLKEVLRAFTPLNSLLEIRFETVQSGHIKTWGALENDED
jgi:type VI secretion system VasI/ImpG family protein